MAQTESWKDIAHALAERMYYQAFNCPEEDEEGRRLHTIPGLHPGCPFCADTVAYLRFQAKTEGKRYPR